MQSSDFSRYMVKFSSGNRTWWKFCASLCFHVFYVVRTPAVSLGMAVFFVAIAVVPAQAREIELKPDYQIPSGRGLVLFTFSGHDSENRLPGTFLVHWYSEARKAERDFFVYGANWMVPRGPDLVEKFGLSYGGRLVAIELPAGKYVLDDLQITGVMQNKLSDGKLKSAFTVEPDRARYIGHLDLEIGDAGKRAGSLLGILLLGADMGGFSVRMDVSDRQEDMRRIVAEHAPQLTDRFDVDLIQAALISRDVHPEAKYPGSGYAELQDRAAVPKLSQGCEARYKGWLEAKAPRAFAVAPNGGCGASWGLQPRQPGDSPVPAERAVQVCERLHGACRLYAVDSRVVYVRPVQPIQTAGTTEATETAATAAPMAPSPD